MNMQTLIKKTDSQYEKEILEKVKLIKQTMLSFTKLLLNKKQLRHVDISDMELQDLLGELLDSIRESKSLAAVHLGGNLIS